MSDALAAFESIRQRGHEDWRYTDLSPAVEIGKRWLASGAGVSDVTSIGDSVTDKIAGIDANWLIVVNGQIDTRYFNATDGVELTRQAVKTSADSCPPLRRLGDMLLEQTATITITSTPGKPVGLLFADDSPDGDRVSQVRIEVEIAAGCIAEIIEYHTSTGNGAHFANTDIAATVASGATLRYLRLQDRDKSHIQTGQLRIDLHDDSRLRMTSIDLGGALIRNDAVVDIVGAGASAEFFGLYLLTSGQHIDNHTRVDHRVGPALSSQEYRGILAGRSRAVWNGKAIVHPGADGTDASQANHNLLLTELAEIDAKPELEIYADDVKCNHGTTVGQLDETALFYLRSRGLDLQQAQQLITRAFAASIVATVPVECCRDHVSNLVDARLQAVTEDMQL